MTINGEHGLEADYGVRNFMIVHMQQYPFIFSDERRYRIRRHFAFWSIWWVFQGFLYSFIAIGTGIDYPLRLLSSLFESLIYLVPHIFLAYSLMYFVIPRFLLRQKYWLTALCVVIIFLITSAISAALSVTIIKTVRDLIIGNQGYNPQRTTAVNIFFSLMAGFRGGITIGGMAASIKLMKYWYVKEQRNLQLQKENVEAQLQLLKAQVHPHFLFNTLNNIYSHTQNTAPVASALVSGLSDMLRFILYESNQPVVALSKEIKMINDYITLEKIRYGNKLDLHVDLPEQTNDLYITPLLLLPLIENSFKHGASNMLDQPWISLKIQVQGQQMQMKLLNGRSEGLEIEETTSGIGIQNVEKRLALLYPNRHEFLITSDDEVFIVNLKIELEKGKDPILKVKQTVEPSHV